MNDDERIENLRVRLSELSGQGTDETVSVAEFRDLAETYIRISSRFSKILDISDKYHALIRTVEQPTIVPAQGSTKGSPQTKSSLAVSLAERLKRHLDKDVATLAKNYLRLQKQLDKIMSISDGYQAQLRETTLQLARMARTDTLTDLPNRRDMVERITIESARCARNKRSYGIIVFDIDRFKSINDSFGHKAGDNALIAVAETLRSVLRTTDVCGRWGGEEFLVLCPEVDRNQTLKVAEKCRAAIEALSIPVSPGKVIRLTVSGGVEAEEWSETLPTDDETNSWEQIVNRADTAMYHAKAAGKNRVMVLE